MIGVKHRGPCRLAPGEKISRQHVAPQRNLITSRIRDSGLVLEFNTNLKEISSVSDARQGSLPSQTALSQEVNFRDNERAQERSSHGGSGLIN